MASGSFLPLGFLYNENANYTVVTTQDVAIKSILYIVPTSDFPDAVGVKSPSFMIVAIDEHTLEENTYYIKANGLTLANVASAITAIDSSSRFTTYPSLLQINQQDVNYGSILVNDDRSNFRVYNPTANTTDLYFDKRQQLQEAIVTVSGNATYAGGGIII